MFVSYLIISGFEECNFTKIFSNDAHSNSNAPFSQETCMHIQHWKQSNTAPMKPIFIVCQYRLLLLNLLLRFLFVDFCPTDLFSKMLSYAYLMMKNKNLLVVLSLKFMEKNSNETVQLDFCVGERKFKKKKKIRSCLIVIIISLVWLLSFIIHPWIYLFCFHTSKIQMTY